MPHRSRLAVTAAFLALFLLLAPARAAAGTPVRDSLTFYYARQDTAAVERLYRRHARTREERLLCLYRLFPMTLDRAYLREIPSEVGVTSARELALIAALWGFRATNGPAYRLPIDGRRSERILAQALARDPDDPYALLVRGQTLYYKPRAFGGSVADARHTFERLRNSLARRTTPGLHPFEAEIWVWMSIRRADPSSGERLRRALLARRPLPLFRQFLVDPP